MFKIYLAGGMQNLSFNEQYGWRNQVINSLNRIDDNLKRLKFINPVDYYNFTEVNYKSEREVMDFDLYHVRDSDLIIVNFNDPKSIGTAMELMLAREMKIPVIGLNEKNNELHPWLKECCTRICDTFEELVWYFENYFN